MSQNIWQETIDTADELIVFYRHLRDKHPDQHNFYQQQMAIAMFKKKFAEIKLKEREREYAR